MASRVGVGMRRFGSSSTSFNRGVFAIGLATTAYVGWSLRPTGFSAGANKKPAPVPPPSSTSSTPSSSSADTAGLNDKTFKPFKIKSVKKITHNTKLYNIDVPTQGELPVSSYILTRATVEGKEEKRPYTPIMQKDGEINLLVKSYTEGKVSKHVGGLKAGDTIDLMGPMKSRPYTPNEFKSVALVAGGTGLTPMLQVARRILTNPDDKTKVHLVFCNSTPEDVILREEIDAMVAKNPKQFSVTYVVSKPSGEWKGPSGRINDDLIAKYVVAKAPPKESSFVYVSGPPGFMTAVSGLKNKDYTQGELSGLLKSAGYQSAQVQKM